MAEGRLLLSLAPLPSPSPVAQQQSRDPATSQAARALPSLLPPLTAGSHSLLSLAARARVAATLVFFLMYPAGILSPKASNPAKHGISCLWFQPTPYKAPSPPRSSLFASKSSQPSPRFVFHQFWISRTPSLPPPRGYTTPGSLQLKEDPR